VRIAFEILGHFDASAADFLSDLHNHIKISPGRISFPAIIIIIIIISSLKMKCRMKMSEEI